MTIIPSTAPLALSAHKGFIVVLDEDGNPTSKADHAEIDRLIDIAQSAPSRTIVTENEDGSSDEITVWETTSDTVEGRRKIREAESAMEKLVNAFLPVIYNTARDVSESLVFKGLDAEEMLSHLFTEFIDYARNRYVVGQEAKFAYAIKRILGLAFANRAREAGLIAVAQDSKRRYLKLMKDHDNNAAHALADCKSGQFTPATFMAVHNAINISDNSLDGSRFDSSYNATSSDENEDNPAIDEAMHKAGYYEGDPADHVAQSALVGFAFLQVEDQRVVQAMKLKYGFDDLATHTLRVNHGFDQYDADVMKVEDVARIVRMGRSTLNKKINDALEVMREAIESTDYDGVSHRSIGR